MPTAHSKTRWIVVDGAVLLVIRTVEVDGRGHPPTGADMDMTPVLDTGSGDSQFGADRLLRVLEPHRFAVGQANDVGDGDRLLDFYQLDPLQPRAEHVDLHQLFLFPFVLVSPGSGEHFRPLMSWLS